jgi:Rieske Fe-S protein
LSELNLKEMKSANIGRRALICSVLALGFGIANESLANATSAAGVSQVGKKLQLGLSKNKALSKVGGVVTINLSDGSQIAVVRTSSAINGFKALNLSCTHQGVTVEQSGNGWLCPAHGSRYSLTGKVQNPPANADLYSYPVKATKTTVTIG